MTVPPPGRCTGRATNLDVPQGSVETLAVPEPPREGPGTGEWVTEGRQRGQSGGTGVHTQAHRDTGTHPTHLQAVPQGSAGLGGRGGSSRAQQAHRPSAECQFCPQLHHRAPGTQLATSALPPAPSNAKGIFSRIIQHNATDKKTFGMSLPCDQAAGPRSTSSETVPAGCGGPVRPRTEGQTQHEVLCWPELCPASSLPKDSYVPGHTAGQQKQRKQEPKLKGPESLSSRRCPGRPVGGEQGQSVARRCSFLWWE